MRAGTLVVWLLCAATPAWVGAAELELGVEAGGGYDSNVLSTAQDPQDAFFARLGPRLRAVDEEGHLRWQIRYYPRYQRYVDLGELDGWDQDAYGEVSWRDARTTVLLSDRYLDYRNFNAIFADTGADPTLDTGFLIGRQRFRQNLISAAIDHQLGARHALELSANHYDNSYDQVTLTTDSTVDVLGGSYLYVLDSRNRIGLALGATRQQVQQGDLNEQRTTYYNLSGRWIHTFSPTLSLNAQAGPTWVDRPNSQLPTVIPDQRRFPLGLRADGTFAPLQASTCPRQPDGTLFLDSGCSAFPPSTVFTDASFVADRVDLQRVGSEPSAGQNLTYFAAISLVKHWENLSFILSYTRDASTAASVSSEIRDIVSAGASWRATRLWTVTLNANYQRREVPTTGQSFVETLEPAMAGGVSDVAEATGFRIVETKRNLQSNGYFVGLYLLYAATKNTQLFLNTTWTNEDTRGDLVLPRNVDRLRVFVGVIYSIPAIQLPL